MALPGVGGTATVYLLCIGFSAVAACWAMGVALRARTIQAAPLMQVVIFLSVFTSVAYAPREVLTGWLRTAADINPVTHILESARAAELERLSWPELWPGLLSVGGMLVVLGAWALTGLASLGRR